MANHHTRELPELSQEQELELRRWLRRKKTAQALALRAQIVLESASGKSDQAVASTLGTTRATVGKWRKRFLSHGCDGLLDEPRPGAPRTVSDEELEQVVTRTLETLPRVDWRYEKERRLVLYGVYGDDLEKKEDRKCIYEFQTLRGIVLEYGLLMEQRNA